jgi:uncharacterized protein YjbI with pentapeptide repeats
MDLRKRIRRTLFIGTALVALLMAPSPVGAADMTVREVTKMLVKARPGLVVTLAGHDLSFLDLSGLDFNAARLVAANLYGADLSWANLRNADLSRALLDRATIIGTDFAQANLSHAVMRLPHSATSPAFDAANAPRFAGANLSHARLVARFDGADFRGADLTGAQLHPYGDGTQNAAARRSSLLSCDFSAAVLVDADLSGSLLAFANFTKADLRGASLRGADLSRTNFFEAELAAADITGADLDGANLVGANGLDKVVGLDLARNVERAVR